MYNEPFSLKALQVVGQSFLLMVKGMSGIFVFMTVFYAIINFLNRLFRNETAKTE